MDYFIEKHLMNNESLAEPLDFTQMASLIQEDMHLLIDPLNKESIYPIPSLNSLVNRIRVIRTNKEFVTIDDLVKEKMEEFIMKCNARDTPQDEDNEWL